MCMKERINVLSTEMDCITAKEAMLKAIAFLERESVDIIEVLSMSALMRARDEDEWIRSTSGFGLILPGETEILEAAGETDRIKLREAENQTFIKMFMKYLQKNRKRVFLLAESEEKLNTVENAMKYYDKGIFLTGHALIKEGEKKPIIIEITDNSMELRIDSAMGSMNENIDIDKEGKDILIGFNPRFLIDALKVIDDETISIYLVNPKAPCFIRDDEENYTYLILPVNINQNQAR